ncbi:MAG: M28 family peptidase [Acidobacteria bacterium]|nr:M28 family peptidase [Acidobacteriota bacterium]
MKRNLFVLFLLVAFVFQSIGHAQPGSAAAAVPPPLKISAAEKKTVEGVTADQLRDYLFFIASDEMEGRNTPSRGLDTVAKFIAFNLKKWGYKPAGDNGTYFQNIALSAWKIDPASTSLTVGGKPLTWGADFLANPAEGNVADAPLVWGGNGWFIKAKNIDPLLGVDVKGKVVVFYAENFPKGMTIQQVRALGKAGEDYMDPAANARSKGAAGVIILNTPAITQGWDRTRTARETGGNPSPDKFRTGTVENFPQITLSAKGSDALLADAGTDLASIAKGYQADALPSVNFTRSVTIKVTAPQVTAKTQNVVALWEGSDPTLKNEMVAIGAHYDHIGSTFIPGSQCRASGADQICNGADDDGSGTVSVLSIAEALAKAPIKPKRSVLFVWHCGEEKGLWGSQYFNSYPTVDIKQVTAQLNIDMIGRSKKPGYMAPCDTNPGPRGPCNATLSGENQIYVIGKDMMSSTLGNIVSGVNSGYLNLNYDTRYDDPKDPNRFFFRSDHYNYAKNMIPIAFWFDGEHEDYHQAGDEPQKIDYHKMESVARTIMLTLLKLTDLKERPKIDKQLPEQLTQGR